MADTQSLSARGRDVYRDFVVSGVPASGEARPDKYAIRALWTQADAMISDLGILGSVSVAYALKGQMDADLAHPASRDVSGLQRSLSNIVTDRASKAIELPATPPRPRRRGAST